MQVATTRPKGLLDPKMKDDTNFYQIQRCLGSTFGISSYWTKGGDSDCYGWLGIASDCYGFLGMARDRDF